MAEIITCVVDDCDWTYDATPPNVSSLALASAFGIGVMASTAASQHAEHIERVLAAHMSGHTVVQFVATISRLRREVIDRRRGCTCPDVDITPFDKPARSATAKGNDPNCPVHRVMRVGWRT